MADQADLTTADYEDFAERHEALHRRRGARGVRSPATRTTSLAVHRQADQPVPRRVGPHAEGGLAQGPVRSEVHAGLRRRLGTERRRDARHGRDRRPPAGRARVRRRTGPAGARVVAGASTRCSACGARSRSAPASALAVFGVVVLVGLWWLAATCSSSDTVPPEPGRHPAAGCEALGQRRPRHRLRSERPARPQGLLDQPGRSASCSACSIGSFRSVEAFWESPIGFLRYIPATALTPLFLIWLGIDEAPEGRADHRGHRVLQHRDDRRRRARGAARDDRHRVHARRGTHARARVGWSCRTACPASSTSPASTSRPRGRCSWSPSCSPRTDGLGYRLTVLRRGSDWRPIFAILLVFAVIGVVSDLVLRWLRNRVSPWARS